MKQLFSIITRHAGKKTGVDNIFQFSQPAPELLSKFHCIYFSPTNTNTSCSLISLAAIDIH